MIVLLALAWVVVLVPSVLKPRFDASPIDGVREFERSMGVLANTRSDRQVPGRWVMVPKGMRAAPTSRRQRLMGKRRRMFSRLLMAAGVTFLLGIIPAFRALWLAHVALDLALVGYVIHLRRLRAAEVQRRRVVRHLPQPEPEPVERERAASQA